MPEFDRELLHFKPHHCEVCGRRLELPFATARLAYAGVSVEEEAPYGELTVMAAGHILSIFDFEETQALEFFQKVRWLALRVQRLENLPPYDIHLEANEGHLAARLTLSSPAKENGSREDLHGRLLKVFSQDPLATLPESLLTRTALAVERELLESKFIFLNRANPARAEALRGRLEGLKSLASTEISDELFLNRAIYGAFDRLAQDQYNLRWCSIPTTPQRPRAIRKFFRKMKPGQNVEMFYKDDLAPRVVAPKWSDDKGFLAYTPSGWRRFLWENVRAAALPSNSFITPEAVRLNRYSDGFIEAVIENYRGDRHYGAGS